MYVRIYRKIQIQDVIILQRMASRIKYITEQLPLELGNTDGILERWGDQVEKITYDNSGFYLFYLKLPMIIQDFTAFYNF